MHAEKNNIKQKCENGNCKFNETMQQNSTFALNAANHSIGTREREFFPGQNNFIVPQKISTQMQKNLRLHIPKSLL
jgi:hypothetical protein